jgi:phosphomannomutase
VPPGDKFVTGGDVRGSTPGFLAALINGLCETGVDVVDLGVLPTPMVYYALRRLDAKGCAIVTASHNPAESNGLKWMIGARPPTQEDVIGLQLGAESPDCPSPDRPRSQSRKLDISFDYVAWLQETWVESLWAPCHAVLDPMHGCWAGRARRYLQAVFPQSLFSAIHDEPDPRFPDGSPDCSQPWMLDEVCDAVYNQRADLGLAFDGDGDRVAVIDDEGVALTAEEATWVLLHSFGEELRKERFVYDLKFSDCVPKAARALGAEPVVQRSGHAFIRSRMIQTGALFGAEFSGHYFFRDLAGGDDGLFAACRLIAHLARSEKTLSTLRRDCPDVFVTPELRVPMSPDDQRRVIEQVRTAWSEHPQAMIDGVRVDFPDAWALVRSSVTEPALTFRFEAADSGWLNELVRRFCRVLPKVGDQLWCRYEAAMGDLTE